VQIDQTRLIVLAGSGMKDDIDSPPCNCFVMWTMWRFLFELCCILYVINGFVLYNAGGCLLSGFMLTSTDQAAAGDGNMFENGVQDAAGVCGYQLNDTSRIEVYCIEPSSNGPESTSYSIKCGTGATQSRVAENCQTDPVSELVKNAYCLEPRPDGEQLQDSYQFVTDGQYQMEARSVNAGSLYRLETGQAYQLDSSDIDINQAGREVNTDSATGSLVLQCVEYVDGGNVKYDGDDHTPHTFQATTVASPMPEGSYEIVLLPNGSRALRKIKPALNANSGVNVKEIQVVEATDASDVALSVGTSVTSSSIVSETNHSVGSDATMVMAAETPTRGGSSYIILPSTLVSKSGLEASSTTVVYQLADGAAVIQGKCAQVAA